MDCWVVLKLIKISILTCKVKSEFLYDYLVKMCGSGFTIPGNKYLICDDSECYIMIQKLDYPVTILGDEFIRLYYTSYKQSVRLINK